MTDRINALTVILDQDIRDDDAQALIDAVKMLRGVLDVTPHVASFEDAIAMTRAKSELRDKLWKVLTEN